MTGSSAQASDRVSRIGLVAVFTATMFLSALLLFSVQPLFTKMVLPVLGGSTSVWAVAMCFFQGALLAGYCYAHILNRYIAARQAGYFHLAFCVLALVSLPIGLPQSWGEPPADDPYLWQLGLFSVAIGLPFLAISANAPLLQSWFAATGHPDSHDPYFLYGASNLGSLIALLSYPLLLEPAFGVTALSRVWAGAYLALIAAIAACFWALSRLAPADRPTAVDAAGSDSDAPGWVRRLGWVGLAFVPSALLTAYTTHVTTDIASAPLLWVIPLALYLLTFVLAFRDRLVIPFRLLLILHLATAVVALLQLSQTRHDSWFVSSATGVAVFFLSALLAHRRLYDDRPAPRYLTEFYLWLSLGGVLGGLFSALVAPRLFSEVYEYPLLVALTIACRPGAEELFRLVGAAAASTLRLLRLPLASRWQGVAGNDADELLRIANIAAAGTLAIVVSRNWLSAFIYDLASSETPLIAEAFSKVSDLVSQWGLTAFLALVLGLALVAAYRYPARQLALALLMFATVVTLPSTVRRGDAQRSYYGVYHVSTSSDGEFNILTHGTTLHGAQRIRDSEGNPVDDTTPTTYYHPNSPMAKTIEIVRAGLSASGRRGRYGVIGLGTGSLACYAERGERWRFFEIDPTVVSIARDPQRFSFLSSCQPEPDIVLGDARLTMTKEPDRSFDLIIVDAFTSDAIPVHLMTAEALRLYASKLTPEGVVLLHISNRYLDLDSVLAATSALVPELDGLILSDDEADGSYGSTTSTVGVFSMSTDALEPFRSLAEARALGPGSLRGWTDDFSDILGPFLSRLSRR
jgi:hypothetical protein